MKVMEMTCCVADWFWVVLVGLKSAVGKVYIYPASRALFFFFVVVKCKANFVI